MTQLEKTSIQRKYQLARWRGAEDGPLRGRIAFVGIITSFYVLLQSDSVATLRYAGSKVTQGERNNFVAAMQARFRDVQR